MPFRIWESVERWACFLVTTDNTPRQRNRSKKETNDTPTHSWLLLDHGYFADSLRRIHVVTLRAVFFLIRILLIFRGRKQHHLIPLSVTATPYMAKFKVSPQFSFYSVVLFRHTLQCLSVCGLRTHHFC
jgi:hypothetical protein